MSEEEIVSKAVKKSKKRTNRSKQQHAVGLSIELVAVVWVFILGLAVFQLGFLGRFFANLIRLFVGDLFKVVGILGMFGAIGALFRGTLRRIPKKWLMALSCLGCAVLLWSEVATFSNEVMTNGALFRETWSRYVLDFKANALEQHLGSGMLGAGLYSLTYFLVSKWGTYVVIVSLLMTSMLLIFNIQWADVLAFLRKTTAALKQTAYQIQEKRAHQKQHRLAAQALEDEEDEIVELSPSLESVQHVEELPTTLTEEPVKHQWADESDRVQTPVNSEAMPSEQITAPPFSASLETKPSNEVEPGTDVADFVMSDSSIETDYHLPAVTLLNPPPPSDQVDERLIVEKNRQVLERTFKSFGVDVTVMPHPLIGPAVTKFEIKPAIGVKVSKIVNLSDDIALALAAKDIRIEAPIPGKPYIGIEVPNQKTTFVAFSDVIQAALNSTKLLDVPLGRDISGNVSLCDLTKMPHLLIAGSTGSGKSVCINGIITSILMKTKPHEVKLMMIDPKMVELNVYNGIPHLLTPVVTNPRKAAQALKKVVQEMENRYEKFAALGMRNIDGYNAHIAQYNEESGEDHPKMPYIVVIVDELADLMMVASNEVEDAIIRLAQMARAAGIHMILATQRPSVDVITGIIKANVPSRIAFAVSSGTDSRTIIDASGAEKLLGRGDMLYVPIGESKPIRVQGAYLADEEVERMVAFVKGQQEVEYVEEMMPSETSHDANQEPEDSLFYDVLEMIKEQETVSTSYIQRRFKIGFNRAARLIEELEERGYVGPPEGSKPRKVNSHRFTPDSDQAEQESLTKQDLPAEH